MSSTPDPHDFLDIDADLSGEERDIRDAVRGYAADQLMPYVADWYETGALPAAELAKGFGQLGLLGMHLEGYGCSGTTAMAYGIACRELEAVDSGLRSFVSVKRRGDFLAYMRGGIANALAEIARLIAIAQLDGFMLTSRRARGHGRLPPAAVGEEYLSFHGRVPAGVQNLPGVNPGDHSRSFAWSKYASCRLRKIP